MAYRVPSAFIVACACALVGVGLAAQDNPGRGRKAYRPNTVSRGTPGEPARGPSTGQPVDIALTYLRAQRADFGLTEADLKDVTVTSSYTSAHNGVTHVYLRQRYEGIDVYAAEANVNVLRDGSIVSAGSSFFGDLAGAVKTGPPARSAADAALAAARSAGLEVKDSLTVQEVRSGPDQATVLTSGGVSSQPITARLVYQPTGPREVRLAWQIEIEELSGAHWWSMTVDAENGEVLGQDDYVVRDFWGRRGRRPTPRHAPASSSRGVSSRGAASPAPNGDGASYRVFAQPKESPNDGGRTLVVDPSNPTASPFGWHDTNGVAGPEFTVTRGNNVHAYTDIDANNVADPGSDPNGTPALLFDFPLDLGLQPATYRPAAVTNLFYWNNIVHDVFYQYGFDEAAGNFQVNSTARAGSATTTSAPRRRTAAGPTTRTSERRSTACGPACRCSSGRIPGQTTSSSTADPRRARTKRRARRLVPHPQRQGRSPAPWCSSTTASSAQVAAGTRTMAASRTPAFRPAASRSSSAGLCTSSSRRSTRRRRALSR